MAEALETLDEGFCPSEAAGSWRVELRFEASRDEEADWSCFSLTLPWLSELSTRDRILLGEALRREGRFLLCCAGPEEAARLFSGVCGQRVAARVFEPDGTEFRPEGAKSSSSSTERTRGVYATPRALTRFVVRSVDFLLRSRLGLEGLSDPGVRLLDPAAGPMNFVLEAYRRALSEHRRTRGREGLEELLRDHLIPHFEGVEILPRPWAEGHSKVRRFAERFGVVSSLPRIPLFLADALGCPGSTIGGGLLGRDAKAVHRLRSEGAFSVVLGNPPFSGRSANPGRWIGDLLRGYTLPDGRTDEGYFNLDGRPLGERNVKWLQDDYVKFLRLAQWIVDQKGQGIVAFVVNHNCLEAPTFRGLRRSLLRTFDQIYALDLHGNYRRRERTPDGQTDENVFEGVAQGIGVLLLVKRPGLARTVYRGDLYGSRREKLQTLGRTGLETLPWTETEPRAPLYIFRSSHAGREREYQKGIPLPEIFPVHSLGVVTGQDRRALAFNREDFEERLAQSGKSSARRMVTSFLVRPFDLRQLFEGDTLERPRKAVMSHLRQVANVGLLAMRQSTGTSGAFVTRWPAGHKVINSYAPNTVFPLFLRAEPGVGRLPNVAPEFFDTLAAWVGDRPSPESVLGYVYAVLHDRRYLSRFGDQLRDGFPRIPLPAGRDEFQRLATLGSELVTLHLLEDERLPASLVQLDGDPRHLPVIDAKALSYEQSACRVRLNPDGLCFEGVQPGVWHHQVGSYQVLDRWLRARAGRNLAVHEIREFRWIAEAIRLSLAVQDRIRAI